MTNQKIQKLDIHILGVIEKSYLAEFIQESLSGEGYRVEIRKNISDALNLLQKISFDIILIDVTTDEEAVFSFIGEIFQQDPEYVVILFSQKADQDMILRALRNGVSDFLLLPLKADELRSSIQERLEHKERRFLKQKPISEFLENDLDSEWNEGDIGRKLMSSLDLNNVLECFLDAALKVTGADDGQLMILEEESGELVIHAQKHFQEEIIRTFRLPNRDAIPSDVLLNGKPAIHDFSTSPDNISKKTPRSTMYVPLMAGDRAIGVLRVSNIENKASFSQQKLSLVSTIADDAAIAIENARLYHETEQEYLKLNSILEHIEDGVIVVRPDFRVLFANRKARLLFDVGEEEIKGQPLDSIFQEDGFICLFKDIHLEMPYTTEITLEEGYILSASLVEIPGIGFAVTLQDISYFKELDRVKTEYVSTVSHDIRSPLTAILGYIQLISKVGEVNSRQQEFIDRIQDNIRSISDLVNSLLELGRIESGLAIFKEDVNFSEVVQHAMEGLRYLVEDRKQVIDFESSSDIPLIFGDPICLHQVVENLIANAILYTPESGKITVRLMLEGEQIIFQVIDNGLGIPLMDQPFIFDKFYRASNIPENTRGSGLGLSIVKSIVEKHQGRVWVNSQPGTGSCFTVILPIS